MEARSLGQRSTGASFGGMCKQPREEGTAGVGMEKTPVRAHRERNKAELRGKPTADAHGGCRTPNTKGRARGSSQEGLALVGERGCHGKGAEAQPPTTQHPLSPAGPGATTQPGCRIPPYRKQRWESQKLPQKSCRRWRRRMMGKGGRSWAWWGEGGNQVRFKITPSVLLGFSPTPQKAEQLLLSL